MSVTQPKFQLSPNEDWIFGVKMRGSTLSFGPSGSSVAAACLACVMMGGIGALMAFSSSSGSTINGYAVRNPIAMMVFGVLTVAYAVGLLVTSLLVGVRADAEGMLLCRLWRRQRLPWSSIADVRAHETVPHRWDLLSGRNVIKFRMRPVASWSVGVVELLDGTIVRLPGFDAAARDDGLSLGSPTATELKVQALSRYRAHVTGRSSDAPSAVPTRIEDDAGSPWVIVWYIGGCLALWLLVSWAAGTLVSPVLLILGIVISLYQFAQRQRIG